MDIVVDHNSPEFRRQMDVAWALVADYQAGDSTYWPALSRVCTDLAGDPQRFAELMHAVVSIASGAADVAGITVPAGEVDDVIRRSRIRPVN